MKRIALALATALLVCSSLFAAQPKTPPPGAPPVGFSFVKITYPHASYTDLSGINNSGYIVGYHGQDASKGFTRLPSGTFAPENYPGSVQTGVLGINNDSSNFETSGYWVDNAGRTHGFLHNASAWTDVDYPGTTYNVLYGLNDDDVAAGYYLDGVGDFHPYIYSQPGNQFTALSFPGSNDAWATGVNDGNEVVGTYLDSSDFGHGFLLTPSFVALNYPGANETYVMAVNNFGAIVGYFYSAGWHGFIYYQGFWQKLDDPDSIGDTFIFGINDNFDIVGIGIADETDYFGWEATPIF